MLATPSTIENPFSSRRIRPGELPFVIADDETIDGLLKRLVDTRLWGQVIGPHGSGKSTLLCTLLPHLQGQGWDVVHGAYRGGRFQWLTRLRRHSRFSLREKLSFAERKTTKSAVQRIVVIDGFERLSVLSRLYWKLRCCRRGDGLLVTAHRDMGLPTLYQTEVTPQLAQRVVHQLLTDGDAGILPGDVDVAVADNPGDLRSALFALYDVYESRREK